MLVLLLACVLADFGFVKASHPCPFLNVTCVGVGEPCVQNGEYWGGGVPICEAPYYCDGPTCKAPDKEGDSCNETGKCFQGYDYQGFIFDLMCNNLTKRCERQDKIKPLDGCYGVGDVCSKDANCVGPNGKCVNGVCVGRKRGESCTHTVDCNAALYCDPATRTCAPLLPMGTAITNPFESCEGWWPGCTCDVGWVQVHGTGANVSYTCGNMSFVGMWGKGALGTPCYYQMFQDAPDGSGELCDNDANELCSLGFTCDAVSSTCQHPPSYHECDTVYPWDTSDCNPDDYLNEGYCLCDWPGGARNCVRARPVQCKDQWADYLNSDDILHHTCQLRPEYGQSTCKGSTLTGPDATDWEGRCVEMRRSKASQSCKGAIYANCNDQTNGPLYESAFGANAACGYPLRRGPVGKSVPPVDFYCRDPPKKEEVSRTLLAIIISAGGGMIVGMCVVGLLWFLKRKQVYERVSRYDLTSEGGGDAYIAPIARS